MATNNAPKHDFAPAWLKIPNQDNSKPPGTKPGEAAEVDDRYSGSYHGDGVPISPTQQNDLDHSKRFPSNQSSKFRHHSVDDDYYAYPYAPYGYYNGYGYHEKYGMHYSSQPSLVRASGQRDSKYQHPHARYGANQNVNVAYPPYYDFLPPYEYYGNEGYYPNYPPGGRSSAKRNHYEREGRSNSKEGKDKDEKKDMESEKDKPFMDDFPSLNGGTEKPGSKGSKQVNGTGVWDNPPLGKTGGSSSSNPSKSGEESTDSSQPKALRDSTIYKSLVPNKSTIPRRPARMNGSYPREAGSFTGLKTPVPTSSSSSPGFSKETGGQPTTPPMDILNTRFVTQPKTLSDKKSHFLKALRQEDSDKHVDKKSAPKGSDGELVNGLDTLGLADDSSHLSSSLEAEQRLLREMGWNEQDEDEYEITEDEMKEFQNLTKQVQQQQRNGVVKSIPKPWSPQHIPLYKPNTKELNETLSSSDSDSDDLGN